MSAEEFDENGVPQYKLGHKFENGSIVIVQDGSSILCEWAKRGSYVVWTVCETGRVMWPNSFSWASCGSKSAALASASQYFASKCESAAMGSENFQG